MMKQFSVVVADFSTEETRKRGWGEREIGGVGENIISVD